MTGRDRTGFLPRFGATAAVVGMVALAAPLGSSAAPADVDPSILPAPAKAHPAPKFGGPGSLTGIWQIVNAPNGTVRDDMLITRMPKAAGGATIPMLPATLAVAEQRLKDSEAGRPYLSTKTRCLPQGIPDFGAGPFQILENGKQVTILRQEFTFFRVIVIGGTHEADPDPNFLGDSVAHWEGGDLIVDTIGLTDKTALAGIIPHSEDLHVVERFHPTSANTMDIEATIDDPKSFSAPWKMVEHVHRITGKLEEYFCENNRNVPTGGAMIAGPGGGR
jgi:hypothetical protein